MKAFSITVGGLLLWFSSYVWPETVEKTVQLVGHFSEDYYANVTTLSKPNPTSAEAGILYEVRVFDARTKKELIKVESDNLAGELEANIKELPYGRQSIVMYEDFNFDGKADFAINDGHNSCYQGPSYQVYLAKNGRFAHSPEFTRLAQEYCGMFRADSEQKRLYTMSKSGCCYHVFDTYRISGNKPILEEHTEELAGNKVWYYIESITHRYGKKPQTTKEFYIADAPKMALQFKLLNQSKKVLILDGEGNNYPDYALANEAGTVEFSYQLSQFDRFGDMLKLDENIQPMRLDLTQNSLCFNNGNVQYRIIDTPQELGVEVQQNGKITFLAGDVASKQGSLDALKKYAATEWGVVLGSCGTDVVK